MPKRVARPKRLTRQENAVHQHQTLLESAIQSVGRVGFSESSVSRITEAAGVAQGTLYSYFGSYQVLLGQLLPVEGARLLQALGEHAHSPDGFYGKERRRFTALLNYLEERPFILRLLIEAEVATPEGFFQYMSEIGHRYTPVFKCAHELGETRAVPTREIQVIAETLAGCRAHIALDLIDRAPKGSATLKKHERNAIEAYVKFLKVGIGAKSVPSITLNRRSAGLALKQNAANSGPTQDMRAAIFEAAGPEIAAVGFSDTLVKKIATRARVSIGTFYSYFAGREEFLSALLLYARRQVTRYIAEAVEGSETFAELEVRSFQALFELMTQKPWLIRLAAEAAVWKPAEYQKHFAVISRNYRSKMMLAKANGELAAYKDEEIETLSIIFTAARRFLGARFVGRSDSTLPKWVVKSYMQLVCCGLSSNPEPIAKASRKHTETII